jgi:alkanesulfonate monooxygenase SsuD/methylene tetrahydromethanopterin reductase-like flavin-dependent oxidoreductase (luciferase family)
MQFALFDHLDWRDEPVSRTYADRLTLIRAAEQGGFCAYHLAEHHGTPLGMAPSPGIFLAAVARETRTLRLGPMVYCLPLYQPLRLLEEICMLDQLSDGRLEIGVGRGASPFENAYFGVPPDQAVERYVETLEILRRGLAANELSYSGKYYNYDRVPLPLRPQQAHIPFWAAPSTPEAQAHAAKDGMNIMVLGSSERVRDVCAGYRARWQEARAAADTAAVNAAGPLLGAYRMVVVAGTGVQAEQRARPAFAAWFEHLSLLWKRHNVTTPFMSIGNFDNARAQGMVITGSPAEVRDLLQAQAAQCGFNYAVLQFAFGTLGHAAEMESLALFTEHVLPSLQPLR